MLKQPPYISIVIPTLNEQNFIKNCVLSLIKGNYSIEKMEVLIIDGGSNDKTREIVKELSRSHKQVKLLNNPKKTVPCALNIGVNAASHNFIVWCGSHAIYDKDYLTNSISVHFEEHCSSSGGVLEPIAKTPFGKSVAIATISRFGIGKAQYRHATSRVKTNTVFGGCFTKKSFEKVGGMNENWIRNQDIEFNQRLRTKVGPVIVDPKIKCQYYCRETLPKLAKQYYQYGYWRLKTILKHPQTFNMRIAAPVFLVLGFIFSGCLLVFNHKIGWALPITYLLTNAFNTLRLASKHKKSRLLFDLPIIFTAIHFSWGWGFINSAINSALQFCLHHLKFKHQA